MAAPEQNSGWTSGIAPDQGENPDQAWSSGLAPDDQITSESIAPEASKHLADYRAGTGQHLLPQDASTLDAFNYLRQQETEAMQGKTSSERQVDAIKALPGQIGGAWQRAKDWMGSLFKSAPEQPDTEQGGSLERAGRELQKGILPKGAAEDTAQFIKELGTGPALAKMVGALSDMGAHAINQNILGPGVTQVAEAIPQTRPWIQQLQSTNSAAADFLNGKIAEATKELAPKIGLDENSTGAMLADFVPWFVNIPGAEMGSAEGIAKSVNAAARALELAKVKAASGVMAAAPAAGKLAKTAGGVAGAELLRSMGMPIPHGVGDLVGAVGGMMLPEKGVFKSQAIADRVAAAMLNVPVEDVPWYMKAAKDTTPGLSIHDAMAGAMESSAAKKVEAANDALADLEPLKGGKPQLVERKAADGSWLHDTDSLPSNQRAIRNNFEQADALNARAAIVRKQSDAEKVLSDIKTLMGNTAAHVLHGAAVGAGFQEVTSPTGAPQGGEGALLGAFLSAPLAPVAGYAGMEGNRLGAASRALIEKGSKIIDPAQLEGLNQGSREYALKMAAMADPLGARMEVVSPEELRQRKGIPADQAAPFGVYNPDDKSILVNRQALGAAGHEIVHPMQELFGQILGDTDPELMKAFEDTYAKRNNGRPFNSQQEREAEVGRRLMEQAPPEAFYGGKKGFDILKQTLRKWTQGNEAKIDPILNAPYSPQDLEAMREKFFKTGEMATAPEVKTSEIPDISTPEPAAPTEPAPIGPASAASTPISPAHDIAIDALKAMGIKAKDAEARVMATAQDLQAAGQPVDLDGLMRGAFKRSVPQRSEVGQPAQNIPDVTAEPAPPDISETPGIAKEGKPGYYMPSDMKFMPSSHPDAIKEAAIRLPDDNVVTGALHYFAWENGYNKYVAGKPRSDEAKQFMDWRNDFAQNEPGNLKYDTIDGFVTNSGEFLDRGTALERAKKMGQISEDSRLAKLPGLEAASFSLGLGDAHFMPARVDKIDDLQPRDRVSVGGITKTLSRVAGDKMFFDDGTTKRFTPDAKVFKWEGKGRADQNMPGFYSKLEKELEAKLPNRASSEQIRGIIRGAGVKKAEIEWNTPLADLLDQPGPHSKQDVLAAAKAGTPRVETRTLAENQAQLSVDKLARALADHGVEDSDHKADFIIDHLGESGWTEDQMSESLFHYADIPDTIADKIARSMSADKSVSQTQYGEHTLRTPGGSNYREVLTHLKDKDERTIDARKILGEPQHLNAKEVQELSGDDMTQGGLLYKTFANGEPAHIFIGRINGQFHVDSPGISSHVFDTLGEAEHFALVQHGQLTGNHLVKSNYTSPHFGAEGRNLLAHLRLTDEKLPDGKNMTFIQEAQSDHGQAIREKGVRPRDIEDRIQKLQDERSDLLGSTIEVGALGVRKSGQMYHIFDNKRNEYLTTDYGPRLEFGSEDRARGQISQLNKTGIPDRLTADEASKLADITQELNNARDLRDTAAPDMPFKGEAWKRLLLRQAIKEAVDAGHDSIGWTTGEQQADRYNLSNHISRLTATKGKDGTWELEADTKNGMEHGPVLLGSYEAHDLPGVVGKEMAQRIIDEATPGGTDFMGLDLKVGGEGMKGFYDKELVNIANDIGKKHGAKVQDAPLLTKKGGYEIQGRSGEKWQSGGFLADDGERSLAEAEAALKVRRKHYPSTEWRLIKNQDETQPIHELPITDSLRKEVSERGQPMFMPGAPDKDLEAVIHDYTKDAGLKYVPHTAYRPINEQYSKDIADAYAMLEHEPNDPVVKKSYDAFREAIMGQYQKLVKHGYTIEPWQGEGQPYKDSADMLRDLRGNKHLFYFPTEKGYGDEGNASMELMHPQLKGSGVFFNGKEALVNDIFRGVHDALGHGTMGWQFGPRGEYNAFLTHASTLPHETWGALANETFGPNSWTNFGPHMRNKEGGLIKPGEEGYLSLPERPFVAQRANFLKFMPAFNETAPNAITSNEVQGMDSRPVSQDEFYALREEGKQKLQELRDSPRRSMDGFENPQRWNDALNKTYARLRQPWGGATLNPETGGDIKLASNPKGGPYAMSAKDPSQQTIEIPIDADQKTFNAAMNKAKQAFPQLGATDHYLGVFRDENKGTIDIDPVLVLDKRSDVEAIGAHTRATGGAFDYSTGDGVYPPHIQTEKGTRTGASGAWDSTFVSGEGVDKRTQIADELGIPDDKHFFEQKPDARQKITDYFKGTGEAQFMPGGKINWSEPETEVSERGREYTTGIESADGRFVIEGNSYDKELPQDYTLSDTQSQGKKKFDTVAQARKAAEEWLTNPPRPPEAPEEVRARDLSTSFKYRSMAQYRATRWGADVIDNPDGTFSLKPRSQYMPGQKTWDQIAAHLDDEELASVKDFYKKRIIDSFKKLSLEKGVEYAKRGAAGKNWYTDSVNAIRDLFASDIPERRSDTDRFAGLLAALSPNRAVSSDLTHSLQAWAEWERLGRPQDRGAIDDIIARTNVKSGEKETANMPAYLNNAFRVLTADDPSKVKLSGPKVDPFFANLRGDMNRVTNDRHMGFYAYGTPTIGKRFAGREGEPGVLRQVQGHKGIALTAHVRQIAKRLSDISGEQWTPAEVQAAIWTYQLPLQDVAKAMDTTTKQLLQDGFQLSQKELDKVPSFASLMNHEANQKPVQTIRSRRTNPVPEIGRDEGARPQSGALTPEVGGAIPDLAGHPF